MTSDSPCIERLSEEQIVHLRTLTAHQKWRKCFEINRRVKAEMYNVVRSDVPYFTEQQVHDSVCAMLLTKAIPEGLDVRAIERELIYGIIPERSVTRSGSSIAEQYAAGEAGPTGLNNEPRLQKSRTLNENCHGPSRARITSASQELQRPRPCA